VTGYDAELEEVLSPPVASWAPIDLGPFLDGTVCPVVPSLLPRTDGVALIYPGLTHSLHGESESGKSWVAQAEAARILSTGGRVLFVDFESDAGALVERLRLLGVDDEAVRARFAYVHPEVDPRSPNEAAAFAGMLTQGFALAVLDGVTDAVGLFGLESRDNDALTMWARLLPKRIADETGAAVVMVDHVTKSAESRGRFAIGGQAKLATITGAAYTVETAQPLGRGLRGVIVLTVAKDRPGYVRGHSGRQRASDRTQEAARIIVDSTLEGVVTITVEPPSDNADGSCSTFRPTTLMERISEALEISTRGPLSFRQLDDVVHGKADAKRDAIRVLVAEGHVTVTPGARGANLHDLVKPYRQADDPLSDRYEIGGTR
jgi:AAA domain